MASINAKSQQIEAFVTAGMVSRLVSLRARCACCRDSYLFVACLLVCVVITSAIVQIYMTHRSQKAIAQVGGSEVAIGQRSLCW